MMIQTYRHMCTQTTTHMFAQPYHVLCTIYHLPRHPSHTNHTAHATSHHVTQALPALDAALAGFDGGGISSVRSLVVAAAAPALAALQTPRSPSDQLDALTLLGTLAEMLPPRGSTGGGGAAQELSGGMEAVPAVAAALVQGLGAADLARARACVCLCVCVCARARAHAGARTHSVQLTPPTARHTTHAVTPACAGDVLTRDAAARALWQLVRHDRQLLRPGAGALGVPGPRLVPPLLALLETAEGQQLQGDSSSSDGDDGCLTCSDGHTTAAAAAVADASLAVDNADDALALLRALADADADVRDALCGREDVLQDGGRCVVM
jgi:hypothetical protein